MRFSGFLSFLFTGEPFSKQELSDVRSEIRFAEAIDAHLAWKQRLVDALTGPAAHTPSAADVGTDTACTLGQWIHGTGQQRYGYLSSFAALRRQHAHFHDLARQIVELARANELDGARRLMDGEFHETSLDIIARIRRLSALFGS